MKKKDTGKTTLRNLFAIEAKPMKGLTIFEWLVVGYTVLTLIGVFVAFTSLHNPHAMIEGRLRILAMTAALWLVYRLVPCRLTMMLRAGCQLAMLSWWYPDTYELNRILPNLDHIFAQAEQWLFGCQPALVFHQLLPWPWFSELMDFGYSAYYPMIAVVCIYFAFWRYNELQRCVTIILGSFLLFFLFFDLVPVTGPTFYFHAIGLDDAARGVFPNLGSYFATHQGHLPTPGWTDGIFYHLVEIAKDAGERPTAAFPSSHVGVATVCMLLVLQARNRKLFWWLMPVYIVLCLSTVYIQAHYAVDALVGLVFGLAFYFLFNLFYPKKI